MIKPRCIFGELYLHSERKLRIGEKTLAAEADNQTNECYCLIAELSWIGIDKYSCGFEIMREGCLPPCVEIKE